MMLQHRMQSNMQVFKFLKEYNYIMLKSIDVRPI